MFVFSVKTSRRQVVSMAICVLLLIAVVLVAVFWPSESSGVSASAYSPVRAADASQRLAFMRELGYEVDEAPVGVKEVLIPESFDDVFNEYNEIQKQAGMDFTPYAGKRMKVWTYRVSNIADEAGGDIQISLYLYKDKIVGGDIHSTAAEGFMRGLVRAEETVEGTAG